MFGVSEDKPKSPQTQKLAFPKHPLAIDVCSHRLQA
jgi:hypothetical protein